MKRLIQHIKQHAYVGSAKSQYISFKIEELSEHANFLDSHFAIENNVGLIISFDGFVFIVCNDYVADTKEWGFRKYTMKCLSIGETNDVFAQLKLVSHSVDRDYHFECGSVVHIQQPLKIDYYWGDKSYYTTIKR